MIFILKPGEAWIVDRMARQFYVHTHDALKQTDVPAKADTIWLLADWCWRQVPLDLLSSRRVICTCHHFVPDKFDLGDFKARDQFVDEYTTFNQRTLDFIRPLTTRPIHLIPYWVDDRCWHRTAPTRGHRTNHGLPEAGYLVGSFCRDTEGAGIEQGVFLPKLEKGPDLLCDFLEKLKARRQDLHVVLAGWRRQYVIGRLQKAGIPFTYFERPGLNVINALYQTLDLYPVTSRHEGGPQALLECGVLGVPCISTPVGIAEQVLPPSAINDDVSLAIPAIPSVEQMKISAGALDAYVELLS